METVAYAETSVCRQKIFASLFGEKYPKDECGALRQLPASERTYEGKSIIMICLQVVKAVQESFTIDYVLNFSADISTTR
jgi:ATP-dependent DNA helicase RecQ